METERKFKISKKTLYALACLGTLVCVAIIIGLNVATSNTQQTTVEAEYKQPEISLDEISGMSNLDFLNDDQKKEFARSFRDYIKSLDKTWPIKTEIYKKTVQKDQTIEFYLQLTDDKEYYACVFDKEKDSFSFYQKDEIDGVTNTPSTTTTQKETKEETKSTDTTQQQTSTTQTQQTQEQAQSTQEQTASQPIKISEATALLSYMPRAQFESLPSIITKYLKQQGINANGQATIIDAATITPNSVGVEFSGWVTDASGNKQNLTIEYNSSRAQFGIGINL